ncbi:MAG: hypothetical protein ACKVQC_06925 [Elusimicrobiota bacterium]
MYIPAWAIILGFVGFVSFILSALASGKGIPLAKYWVVPLAAILPWIIIECVVLVWINFEKNQSRAQAMAMSGLFPLFGLFGSLIMGAIISFFVSPTASIRTRFLWSGGISLVPALVLGILLVYVFLKK